jgi:hypothetical protein
MDEFIKRLRIFVKLKDGVRYKRAMNSLYRIVATQPTAITSKEQMIEIIKILKTKNKSWQRHFFKIGSYVFDRVIHEVDKSHKTMYEVREPNTKQSGILTYCRHPTNSGRKNGRCYAPNCSCPFHFSVNVHRLFYEFLRTKRQLSLKKHTPDDFTTLVLGCETQTDYKMYMKTNCHKMFGEVPYEDMSIDEIKPCSAFDIFDEVQALQCFNYRNNQLLFKDYSHARRYGFAERHFVNSAKRDDPCSFEHADMLENIEFTQSQKNFMRSLVSDFLEKRLR